MTWELNGVDWRVMGAIVTAAAAVMVSVPLALLAFRMLWHPQSVVNTSKPSDRVDGWGAPVHSKCILDHETRQCLTRVYESAAAIREIGGIRNADPDHEGSDSGRPYGAGA